MSNNNHNHGRLNRVRRAADKAIINWQNTMQDEQDLGVEKVGPSSFKIVAYTQVYENYGAHCWDGVGDCPQYWKAKGGDRIIRDLGNLSAVVALGMRGVEKVAGDLIYSIERSDEFFSISVIDWEVVDVSVDDAPVDESLMW